jgi:hypothetical protein
MEGLPYRLSRWTTDELIGEVVRRSATDGPALKLLERTLIRARLAEADGRPDADAPQTDPAADPTWVLGTMEMSLADRED